MHELDQAPFGINSLETTLALVATHLIEPGHLTWLKAVEKLSTNPARLLQLTGKGSLEPGADADVTIIDPHARWIVDPQRFFSISKNTPLTGVELVGRADSVFVGGELKFDRAGSTTASVASV